MIRPFHVIVTAALAANTAFAQSFNIDFDESPGEAASAPLATFGGAMVQPGFWNVVPASDRSSRPLLDLAGAARGVMIDRIGGEGGFTFDHPNTTGEFHFLLDDLVNIGFEGSTTTIRLTGLVPGVYRVVTYAISPDNPGVDRTSIFVSGATGANPQLVGGDMPVNAFGNGFTHSDHTAAVESTHMNVTAIAATGYGSVNGMQVKLIAPRRLHVRPEAPAGGDGTTWSRAYRTLGEALARAAASGDEVREVWVARGTHRPSETNPMATFTVPRGVRVYGGFVGNETTLARRDILANRTVLSGRLEGAVRSRWVAVLQGGAEPFTIGPPALDGFTVEDGGLNGVGGGVRIVGRGDVFRCTLRGHSGGAIRAEGAARIVGCDVSNNTGIDGAGIHASAAVLMLNTRLHGNLATGRGGGVFLNSGGSLAGVASWGNAAAGGAGAYIASGDADLVNCTLALNRGAAAAGLFAGGSLRIENSMLSGNRESRANPAPMLEQNLTVAGWPSAASGSRNLVEGYAAGPLLLTWSADPVFADPLGPDGVPFSGDESVAVAVGSPAIDAGDTGRLPVDIFDLDSDGDTDEVLPIDAAGNDRRSDDLDTSDTGCCEAPVVDLGAFEYVTPPPCPADFNQDGGVDGSDVEAFFLVWETGGEFGDVNRDGGVDGGDVEFFFLAWEAGGC
ncbi:MAG: hypothetical protein JNK25_03160 [Phycisphaerae bacterium]|nr:hypothetical protein [Phycisphaerae bacterium]